VNKACAGPLHHELKEGTPTKMNPRNALVGVKGPEDEVSLRIAFEGKTLGVDEKRRGQGK